MPIKFLLFVIFVCVENIQATPTQFLIRSVYHSFYLQTRFNLISGEYSQHVRIEISSTSLLGVVINNIFYYARFHNEM